MKLVLVHTDRNCYGVLSGAVPPPLIPLYNKPVAQHQIEQGYACDLKSQVIIASDGLKELSKYFGDGTRFGVKLSIINGHLSGDECKSLLKHRFLFEDRIMVVAGLSISSGLDLKKIIRQHKKSKALISLICSKKNPEEIQAAILEPESFDLIENSVGGLYQALGEKLESDSDKVKQIFSEAAHLSGSGASGILEINKLLLLKPELMIHSSYFEQEKGVFLGHGVSIHPDAEIIKPVLIGHHCQIMAGAKIGKNAVVGENTIVAQRAELSNCVIIKNSYIGEMTKVDKSIVAENMLFSEGLDAKIVISDQFLLGSVEKDIFAEMFEELLNRSVALGLFVSLAPFGILAGLKQRRKSASIIKEQEVLGAGNVENINDLTYISRFRTLQYYGDDYFVWWPTLINVMKGDMRLIGPKALTEEEAFDIEDDWMLGRFKRLPGVIEVAGFCDNESESRIVENLYAEKHNTKLDIKIAIARFVKPILGKKIAKRLIGL